MDAILGHRPVVVNSMEDSRPGDTTVHTVDEPTAGEPQPDERGNTSDQELDDSDTGSSKDTPSSSRSGTPMAPQQRKHRRSKGDENDTSATSELISKLLMVQEESDYQHNQGLI